MPIKVCLAGVTGWVGRELTSAIVADARFQLTGAVARRTAGQTVRNILGVDADVRIMDSVAAAVEGCHVFVDFTAPAVVKNHVYEAMNRGCHVVIGTSGLNDAELAEIGLEAERRNLGVFAAGNFALTAVLLQECARLIAKHVKHYEIIDYAPVTKIDAPSGTARETARDLARVSPAEIGVPLEQTHGLKECRGGDVSGVQIHSVRLPSFHFGFEVIFAASHERLALRHEVGSNSLPYVAGALLAIERVSTFTGLRRGLQTILQL